MVWSGTVPTSPEIQRTDCWSPEGKGWGRVKWVKGVNYMVLDGGEHTVVHTEVEL